MKRAILVVIAGIAVGLAVAWWFVGRRPTPPTAANAAEAAATPRWLDTLYSRNPREAAEANREVAALGPRALPVIQAVLRDPQSEAERLKAALKACTILGKEAAPAIGEVAAVLAEEGLTAEAAVALSYMGPAALQPLRDGLRHSDPIVRRESLRSLGKLTERAPLEPATVTPLLIASMKDADGTVRAVAATYLGIIHAAPERAIPALVAGLQDDNPEVRRESATALGAFGDAALPALPALRKASGDRNEDVAREAGRAIVKLQQK